MKAPLFLRVAGLCGGWLLPVASGGAEPTAPVVHESAALDQVPVPLLQPKPVVPAGLALETPPEPVEVSFVVDAMGVVREPRVVKAGRPELDVAAMEILARWRFRPGRKGGEAVASRLIMPVVFSQPDTEAAGPFAGPVIVPVEELDRAPMLRYQENPLYPPDLRRRGIGGEVLVEFVIDERGIVRAPRVLSAPHTALGESAENAVGQWTFYPGMKDGRPVATRLQVPIEFTPPR